MADPLNILAEIVFSSANDVLAGLQTWEEHEAYLRQTFEEYAAKGIKLPLELTKEPDYEYKNDRPLLYSATRQVPKAQPQATGLFNLLQGVRPGAD